MDNTWEWGKQNSIYPSVHCFTSRLSDSSSDEQYTCVCKYVPLQFGFFGFCPIIVLCGHWNIWVYFAHYRIDITLPLTFSQLSSTRFLFFLTCPFLTEPVFWSVKQFLFSLNYRIYNEHQKFSSRPKKKNYIENWNH